MGQLHMAQKGIADSLGKSARLRSVSAGATQVRLTAASASAGYISRAVVGSWMAVASFDIQGLFLAAYGFPPNAHFIDFVQITAVGTDTINFTPALRYSHSDRYPCFNTGNAFEVDSGGPATAYFLHADWGATMVVNGGTNNNNSSIHCEGMDFTCMNMTCTDAPIYPTVTKIWRSINNNMSSGAGTEVDKFIDQAYVNGGGSAGPWHTQSSSIRYTELKDCTFGYINGTGKETVLDNITLTNGGITAGPVGGYGVGETLTIKNCTNLTGDILPYTGTFNIPSAVTMANGIITMPLVFNTDTMLSSMVPDEYGRNVIFWGSNLVGGTTGASKILEVWGDSWPAADNQTSSLTITSVNGSPTITVATNSFTSADIGKTILVGGAANSASQILKAVIIAVGTFSSTQDITLDRNASRSQTASTQTVQWGTCNAYIRTDDTGGFPTNKIPAGTTTIKIRPNAIRSVYATNCTGNEPIVDLCNAGAQGRPMWSYTKRQYTGQMPIGALGGNRITAAGAVAGTGSKIPLTGKVVRYEVNVITPYTGVAGTLKARLSQFDNGVLYVNGVATSWNPAVNLRIPGKRVMLPGQAATGVQTGDANLDLPADGWMTNGFSPLVSTNVTAEYLANPSVGPVYTVEMITDQGAALDAGGVGKMTGGLAVVTVASGGLPVVDVTATTPNFGLPISEAPSGRGLPVTKVVAPLQGLPVTYVVVS